MYLGFTNHGLADIGVSVIRTSERWHLVHVISNLSRAGLATLSPELQFLHTATHDLKQGPLIARAC